MIINDDSRAVNKLEASLTYDARVIIYDRHLFIVQATESLSSFLDTFLITVGDLWLFGLKPESFLSKVKITFYPFCVTSSSGIDNCSKYRSNEVEITKYDVM
jgi:hypothetical protein